MGRGKLSMELIKKEKSRNMTYQKRKKGLMKKAFEFSTLCSVDTCMIIYGPKLSDRPVEIDTWPKNRDEVERIINKYKANTTLKRARGAYDLSDFFTDRKKKLHVEISRSRCKAVKAKYPTWDTRIDYFMEPHLRVLLNILDAKAEVVRRRIEMMRGNQYIMEKSTPGMMIRGSLPALSPDQLPPISYMKPTLDIKMHPQYQIDQGSHHDHDQMLPFDPSPTDNSFMKLLMNDNDWTQFGTASTSTNNVNYAPLSSSNGPSNSNLMSGMLESVILNNPSSLMSYYDLTRRQFMPRYMQSPTMPNLSSQMHGFQVNEADGVSQFDTKIKNARSWNEGS